VERLDVHALCAVPVRYLGRVVGALGLVFPAPRQFDRDDRARLQVFGARYARGLHDARLYFAERQAHADADRLRAEADTARREAEVAREVANAAREVADAAREAADAARADADAANGAKTRAIQVVTHDLRNPLQAILGYADLMADEIVGPLTVDQRRSLDRLRTAGAHLIELIDDLFAAARPDAANEPVDITSFPLAALCAEVTAVAEPLAGRKGLAFRCAAAGDAGDAVLVSDRRKLRQALVNLVVNAIKFTPAGTVTVSARVIPDHDGAGASLGVERERAELVEFGVADTGVGIAPEHLARIFDAFWQVPGAGAPDGVDRRQDAAHGSAARVAGRPETPGSELRRGAGLGLSIARRYVERLGGTLTVASEPGRGSTFTVRVPRRG
jgi:signal transduction histidine kinase